MTNGAFEANLANKLGAENLKRVESARIGIAGAGGLGSNCALCLVRSGFRKLTIVDFDTVEPSNLDRQFYFQDQVGMRKTDALKANLDRVNPRLELRMVNKKIAQGDAAGLFSDCDAVVECLDSAEAKRVLVEELMAINKFTVTASGLGGVGSSDEIKVRRLRDTLVMIGDLESDVSMKPALSPRVSMAAAKQADTILEHILNK